MPAAGADPHPLVRLASFDWSRFHSFTSVEVNRTYENTCAGVGVHVDHILLRNISNRMPFRHSSGSFVGTSGSEKVLRPQNRRRTHLWDEKLDSSFIIIMGEQIRGKFGEKLAQFKIRASSTRRTTAAILKQNDGSDPFSWSTVSKVQHVMRFLKI